jgi:hypothetical protein
MISDVVFERWKQDVLKYGRFYGITDKKGFCWILRKNLTVEKTLILKDL